MNLDKRHVCILNRKYCPLKEMTDGKAEVLYSYEPVAQGNALLAGSHYEHRKLQL